MKKFLIISPLLAVALCAASSWFAYRQGVHDGMVYMAPNTWSGLVQNGTLIQELRNGQTEHTINVLEGQYYASADWALAFGSQQQYPALRTSLDRLVAYRREHARPAAEWTPCEQEVEQQLAAWQQGQSQPFDVDLHLPQVLALAHPR